MRESISVELSHKALLKIQNIKEKHGVDFWGMVLGHSIVVGLVVGPYLRLFRTEKLSRAAGLCLFAKACIKDCLYKFQQAILAPLRFVGEVGEWLKPAVC